MVDPLISAMLLMAAIQTDIAPPPPPPPTEENIACTGPWVIQFGDKERALSRPYRDMLNVYISCYKGIGWSSYRLEAQTDTANNIQSRRRRSTRRIAVVARYLGAHGLRSESHSIILDPAEKIADGCTSVYIVPARETR